MRAVNSAYTIFACLEYLTVAVIFAFHCTVFLLDLRDYGYYVVKVKRR